MRIGKKYALALALGLLVAGIGVASAAPALAPGAVHAPVAETEHCDVPPDHAAFGIAVRWGILNDPIHGFVRGEWTIEASGDRGGLVGVWASENGRIEGPFVGSWEMGPDGHGRFLGHWSSHNGTVNGTALGEWIRVSEADGVFRGHWTFGEDRPGGPVAGEWIRTGEDGGRFGGKWLFAGEGGQDREGAMTPWDGFLSVTHGALIRAYAVRFETGGDYRYGTDDLLYPRTNRFTVEWRSSTTTAWDGVVAIAVVPAIHRVPVHVTLHTDQWSRIWELPELHGLHVRERVDRGDNEIEVRTFPVDRGTPCREEYARIEMRITWGVLGEQPVEVNGPFRAWDGQLRVRDGGIRLRETLGFETGGDYANGTDDRVLLRQTPQVLAWRSSTVGDSDGVAVTLLVPLHREDTARVGFHTEAWSGEWTLHELLDLNAWVDVDDLGNAIHIESWRA